MFTGAVALYLWCQYPEVLSNVALTQDDFVGIIVLLGSDYLFLVFAVICILLIVVVVIIVLTNLFK